MVSEFFLDGPQEAEDHVIKWLVTSVKDYLDLDSPWLSYPMHGLYIKTEQGYIDVNQHFNNFHVNPEDQSYLGICFVHTNNAPGAVEKETLM